MRRILRARACAKINLGLRIVGLRPDGFHELRTVLQTVALSDAVSLELGGRGGTRLEIEAALGCEAPEDESNLAWRAAEAAREAWGWRGAIHIRLRKRIPVGAGLGGGSSDAAAVLRLLAEVAPRPVPLAGRLALAASLGSDVPAFLLGGTVLGLGRGEEVYPLPDLPPWQVVLAIAPGLAVSTPEAYRRWDSLTGGASSDTISMFGGWLSQLLPAFRLARNRDTAASSRRMGASVSRVQAGIENDLQEAVFSLSLDFPRLQDRLRRLQAEAVGLSGSGAAQFGLFASRTAAAHAAGRLARQDRVWQTRFLSRRQSLRGGEA